MGKRKRYCLQCDDGTALVRGARDMPVRVDGVCVTVEKVRGWHCPVCGECEFEAGEGARYSAALDAVRVQADVQRVAEIRAIRKRLKLTQAQAAELFGGGINAFSEYERGKTRPHKATMLLLRLLGQRPELLGDIRPEPVTTQSQDQRGHRRRARVLGEAAQA